MYATNKQRKYEREKSIGEKGKLIEKRDAIECACGAKEQLRSNDNEKRYIKVYKIHFVRWAVSHFSIWPIAADIDDAAVAAVSVC